MGGAEPGKRLGTLTRDEPDATTARARCGGARSGRGALRRPDEHQSFHGARRRTPALIPARSSVMKALIVSCLAAVAALPLATQAQVRQPGWEFGGDVIYQDSSTVTFDGGTKINFHDDWGLDLSFGYRF